ncbi:unnamed protein product, partial [Ectocarpus sp. 6 AP-2014]
SPCPPQLHDVRRALMGSGRRNNAAHPSYESLDAFFCGCLERVEAAYATLNKAFKKIRVECWIAKLNGPYPLPNVAWRKNRNAFAALLARAVEEVDFREPFDRRPPEGSLPTLAPHLRARIPDRNPFQRTGSDFWLRHRAWLDTSRGLSGRDFANEAAEASRTFQPTRRGSPSLTSQDPRFASPGLQGGGYDATADTTVIGGGITSGITTTAGGCCGATTAALSPLAPPPPPNPSSPRIHSGGGSGSGNNNAAPCAAAARGPCGTRTTKSKRCPCDPLGKAGFEGGAGGAPRGGGAGGGVEAAGERVGCGHCGCDGERVRALQRMVREQALQLAALRLQQAYRGRAQAAELQRVRHERCRLTSVRLEEMLARRGGREEQNRQAEEDQDASSSPRPPQLNPPLPGLSKKGAAADLNVDLERRLDRFQEDARVLVGVAKQHHHHRQ